MNARSLLLPVIRSILFREPVGMVSIATQINERVFAHRAADVGTSHPSRMCSHARKNATNFASR
jgi:hypothetical protein